MNIRLPLFLFCDLHRINQKRSAYPLQSDRATANRRKSRNYQSKYFYAKVDRAKSQLPRWQGGKDILITSLQHCYGARIKSERWQSGWMHRSWKPAWVKAHRGFESHPLRHTPLLNISFNYSLYLIIRYITYTYAYILLWLIQCCPVESKS